MMLSFLILETPIVVAFLVNGMWTETNGFLVLVSMEPAKAAPFCPVIRLSTDNPLRKWLIWTKLTSLSIWLLDNAPVFILLAT